MFDFPGVKLEVSDEVAILTSEQPLLTLSSAVVGGGMQQSFVILNRHVPMCYDCTRPIEDLHSFAIERGITRPFVGMLTGVPMHGTRVSSFRCRDGLVTSVITAGVGNAMTAGVSEPVVLIPGTINISVLIDARLAPAAMVNAVITATEAKSGTLCACDIYSEAGERATGTSTDAIVIACTGRGEEIAYAGPGTEIGHAIAYSVRSSLLNALEPCGVFLTK
jgi:adenosylcobinamide hydrolase